MISERKRHDLEVQLDGLKEGWKALGLRPGQSVPLYGITAGHTQVKKCFEVENRKYYKGTVKSIWALRPKIGKGAEIMAHVSYEDGDSEDLSLKELRSIIESNVESKKFRLADFRLTEDVESVPLLSLDFCGRDPEKEPIESEREPRLNLAIRQINHLSKMTTKALEILSEGEKKEDKNNHVTDHDSNENEKEKKQLSMWLPLDGLKRWAKLKWNLSERCWKCYIPSLGLSRNFPVPFDSLQPESDGKILEGVEDAYMRAKRWMNRRRGELRVKGVVNRVEPNEATSDDDDTPAWSLDECEHPIRLVTLQQHQLKTDCKNGRIVERQNDRMIE